MTVPLLDDQGDAERGPRRRQAHAVITDGVADRSPNLVGASRCRACHLNALNDPSRLREVGVVPFERRIVSLARRRLTKAPDLDACRQLVERHVKGNPDGRRECVQSPSRFNYSVEDDTRRLATLDPLRASRPCHDVGGANALGGCRQCRQKGQGQNGSQEAIHAGATGRRRQTYAATPASRTRPANPSRGRPLQRPP